MRKNKKILMGAAINLSIASICSPILMNTTFTSMNSNSKASTKAASYSDWVTYSETYLNRKTKSLVTSSSNGYFKVINSHTLSYYSYISNDPQWTFDIHSNELIDFNGVKVQLGSYANPFAYKENGVASSETVILDIAFNKDNSRIVVLTGRVTSEGEGGQIPGWGPTYKYDGKMYLSMFQIDITTGKPYINNINSPEAIYNSAYSDSTNGGKIVSFNVSRNRFYPFLSISNDNAMVMVQQPYWTETYNVNLENYISQEYTFDISSIPNLQNWSPFAFLSLNDEYNIMFFSKGQYFGWVKLDKDYNIAGNFVDCDTHFGALYLSQYNLSIFPSMIPTSDGNSFYMYVETYGESNQENPCYELRKYNVDSGSYTSKVSFIDDKISNINYRKENNSIFISTENGFKIYNAGTFSEVNNITYPSGMNESNFAQCEIKVINSEFNQSEFSGGSGALLKTSSGSNYWLKVNSSLTMAVIEEIEEKELVASFQEGVTVQAPLSYNLASSIKFNEITDYIGYVTNQSPSPFEYKLIDKNGKIIPTEESNNYPISSYYNSSEFNGSEFNVTYQVLETSWWNSNIQVSSTLQSKLKGFSTSDDYFVEAKMPSSENWNGMNFIPSTIRKETVINNMTFGNPGKTYYPINSSNSLETNMSYIEDEVTKVTPLDPSTSVDPDFSFSANKYIKLYANDNEGVLTIVYNFENCTTGNFRTDSNLPSSAIRGVINVRGFKTSSDFEVFSPSLQNVTNFLEYNYSHTINSETSKKILPQNLSSGFSLGSWTFKNFVNINNLDETIVNGGIVTNKQALWNNYSAFMLEYNGPTGADLPDENVTRRIIILPDNVPESGEYSININGLSEPLEGTVWNEDNPYVGDIFFNSKDIIDTAASNSNFKTWTSVISKIMGIKPTTDIDGNIDNAFLANSDLIQKVITDNLSQEDIDAFINNESAAVFKVKKYLFNYIDESSTTQKKPAIFINNKWINYNDIELNFEKVETKNYAESSDDNSKYFINYKFWYNVPQNTPTIIPNADGTGNLTVSQLGLDSDSLSLSKENAINVSVLNFDEIFKTLQLQEKLINQGVTLDKIGDTFETNLNIRQISNEFCEENYVLSPTSLIQKMLKMENGNEEEFPSEINNFFSFLNTTTKFKESDNYNAFDIKSVNFIADDTNGVMKVMFKIKFNSPLGDPEQYSLPPSLSVRYVTLNITGLDSYNYETTMWLIFSVVLFSVIIFILIMLVILRKEHNKKRLWNIKK